MAKILIVDDDQMLCEMLAYKLDDMGHGTVSRHLLSEGVQCANDLDFDLVLLDVGLPDGSGLTKIQELRSTASQPEIIVITGEGDLDGAETAIKTGAWDYIEKPLSTREIALNIQRALQYREEKLSQKPATLLKREKIVGSDPNLVESLELVAQAAGTDAGVLITGETGTGKELFARAIHENSDRCNHNFVVVDCAAMPETLVESELFGHYKGAFTGADASKDGLIKMANGGTLFLDEVGELPLSIQKAFLRVLQEKRYRPIGSRKERQSDFRLIAATHRNLEEMTRVDLFRRDLMFRLRSIEINLPPLKRRAGDVETLLNHFLSKLCKRYEMGMKTYSPVFLQAMETYQWPGNVRELENAIDSAICQALNQSVLYPMHLPKHIRVELARISLEHNISENIDPKIHLNAEEKHFPPLKKMIEETEKAYLQDILHSTGGNVQKAARISGLSRTRFYARLKKYGITRPQ